MLLWRIARCITRARTRPRSAMRWARRCWRCLPGTSATHIAALRGDEVLPELLGMSRIVSEDAVRRAFATIEEEAGAVWLRRHLDYCLEPLLAEAWILDVDTTVKPLCGRQEGAVAATIPRSPGGRAIDITPIRWPARDWCSTWTWVRAISTPPSIARPVYGRCWMGRPEIAGRPCCAATKGSATKRPCAKPSNAGCPICSSCG